ncbi:LppU/SCO3897 family protein [Streptomyces apocyni]|uniref:LppU/SCO3897 family protein n=1 Tax=Streptomyces apocyni TaxID=2654677 RepID=UPI0012EAC793|nr:hypothetical protein [Streptomyces apocyni]
MTTPQPQGQNPFNQAPQGDPQQPFPGAPPAQPTPSRSVGKKVIIFVVGSLVAVGLLFGVRTLLSDDTTKLAAGDCLKNEGSNTKPDIKKVDCGGSDAEYKVLEKKDSGIALSCQSIEGNVAAITWKEGSDSFVLCLGKA